MNGQGPPRFDIVDPAYIPLSRWPPPIQFPRDGDRTEKQVLSELAVAAVDGADRVLSVRSSGLHARFALRSRGVDRRSRTFARSPWLVFQGRELPR